MIKKLIKFIPFYKTPYQKTKREIIAKLNKSNINNIDDWLALRINNQKFKALDAYRILFSLLKNSHPEMAIKYGEKAQQIEYSKKIEKILQNRKKLIDRRNYTVRKLKEFYYTHSLEETIRWLDKAIKIRPKSKMQFYKTFFTLAKKDNLKIAIKYGEKALLLGADKKFKKVVLTRKRWLEKKYSSQSIDFSDISIKEIKSIVDELLEISVENALEYVNEFDMYDINISLMLKQYIIKKINKIDPKSTVEIGLDILDKLNDKSLLKIIAARAYAIKDYSNSLKFYKKYFSLTKDQAILDRIVLSIVNTYDLTNYSNNVSIANKIINNNFNSLSSKLKHQLKDKILFELYMKDGDYQKAIKYGSKIISYDNNITYPIKLARAYFELGQITNAIEKSGLTKDNDKHQNLISIYKSYLRLKDNGFSMSRLKNKKLLNAKAHNILYVINNSLPYHSNGYATRAHGLLQGIHDYKNISAITRLGYPHDLVKFRENEYINKHKIDNIKYYHLTSDKYWLNYMPLDNYLEKYSDYLVEFINQNDIELIHSASNFVNGLAANQAAKKAGIKCIYEVRGLWEITRISRQPQWENSEHFNMIKRLETQAAQSADQVITITYALKEELIRRGIDGNKISVLPNGVNSTVFQPLKKDLKLMKQLNIKENDVVIGYIGSIVEYEGIDLLVEAIAKLKSKNILNFKFLLVGDGRYFENIKNMIKKLNVEDLIIVTGRVPHEDVENYYSLIDIAPLPRKALPVSEMVSPLKPFEAMAMGKIVLGSSVAAIAEIIKDGFNGMLFEKSNVEDLTTKLEILIQDKSLRKKIGHNARRWVEKERDWKVLSKKLIDIYNK